jgi:hypothetical protein
LITESAGLLFLTPVFEKLPNNALAAIVVAGLVSIFDYEEAIWLWKVSNLAVQPLHLGPGLVTGNSMAYTHGHASGLVKA